MANDGRDDPDAPLQASVGEQLMEKAHHEEAAAAERRAKDLASARVERKKADEREAVSQHLQSTGAASPEGWREARERARALGRNRAAARTLVESLLPIVGGAAVLLGLLRRGRSRRVLLAAGLPLVWRSLAARRRERAAEPA